MHNPWTFREIPFHRKRPTKREKKNALLNHSLIFWGQDERMSYFSHNSESNRPNRWRWRVFNPLRPFSSDGGGGKLRRLANSFPFGLLPMQSFFRCVPRRKAGSGGKYWQQTTGWTDVFRRSIGSLFQLEIRWLFSGNFELFEIILSQKMKSVFSYY